MADVERHKVERARDRSCGACSLCCKLVKVGKEGEPFQKPQGEWCIHCKKPGCGIYDERPEPCRAYTCLWLRGVVGTEDDRPDRSRFVIDLEQTGVGDDLKDASGKTILKDQPVWCFYTDRENTLKTKRAARTLRYLESLTVNIGGEWRGPFAICVIPPLPAIRWILVPGVTQGYVPVLRPGEEIPT